MQRLLNVPDKMEQVTQSRGPVSLGRDGTLQVGDTQVDSADDIERGDANPGSRRIVESERQIDVMPNRSAERTLKIVSPNRRGDKIAGAGTRKSKRGSNELVTFGFYQ